MVRSSLFSTLHSCVLLPENGRFRAGAAAAHQGYKPEKPAHTHRSALPTAAGLSHGRSMVCHSRLFSGASDTSPARPRQLSSSVYCRSRVIATPECNPAWLGWQRAPWRSITPFGRVPASPSILLRVVLSGADKQHLRSSVRRPSGNGNTRTLSRRYGPDTGRYPYFSFRRLRAPCWSRPPPSVGRQRLQIRLMAAHLGVFDHDFFHS